ncbi:MAG: tetratricopeptide repeat protein [Chthoniobacterales bacterium]
MTGNFFAELKRRNVYKVAVAYAVVSWLLIQIATQVFPFFEVPNWAIRLVVLLLVLGFPVALVLSWAFEITPEGIKRESDIGPDERRRRPAGRRIIGITIALAVVAAGLLAWQLLQSRLSRPSPSELDVPPTSIAVLPFADMSQGKDQGYFSDGISEELLNLLTKIPQLKVAARTSSFSFKGKQVEIPEIARLLRVAYVLEGSVRKSGDLVRITTQLIRVADGYHLWSETYDRKMTDIFNVQDEIAGEVVRELKVKLLAAPPKVRTTDPQAYALYLEAKELARKFTPEAFAKSDAFYRQALDIDPRYAPAWTALAVNFIAEFGMGLMSSEEANARALEAVEKALAIDPEYAPAHAALGMSATQSDNDLAGAARHLERALALDPTGVAILSGAANLLSSLGRLDQALALHEAAVRHDPVSVATLSNLGACQCASGRYDEAIGSYRAVLRLSPGRGGAHAQLGMVLLQKGDAPAALAEIEQEKNETWKMVALPMAYCALGRAVEAEAAREALIAKYEKDWSYNIAYVFAFCGRSDKAFEWLDKAVAYQERGLSEIVAQNLFDKIHSDPRWLPFLHKLGKAPQQLARIQFKVTHAAMNANLARASWPYFAKYADDAAAMTKEGLTERAGVGILR